MINICTKTKHVCIIPTGCDLTLNIMKYGTCVLVVTNAGQRNKKHNICHTSNIYTKNNKQKKNMSASSYREFKNSFMMFAKQWKTGVQS
jgi:hypothetical protein